MMEGKGKLVTQSLRLIILYNLIVPIFAIVPSLAFPKLANTFYGLFIFACVLLIGRFSSKLRKASGHGYKAGRMIKIILISAYMVGVTCFIVSIFTAFNFLPIYFGAGIVVLLTQNWKAPYPQEITIARILSAWMIISLGVSEFAKQMV